MEESPREHFDVLIVGAGLSGVGAGCRVVEQCPDKSFVILEARDVIGGTWDLFRYPGIRSDSDMYSLGYSFRPWPQRNAIGEGSEILQYIRDTAAEFGVDEHIRFGHRVTAANWSSADARWEITVERGEGTLELTAGFLYWASGYYRYDEGYTPEFEGRDRFGGPIIHPQHWDPELDYAGKRVVVIGSGATAVTLVPSLVANGAGHVTMLQRSPTYIYSYPRVDPLAKPLLTLLPNKVAHAILRWKNVAFTAGSWSFSRRWPRPLARYIVGHMRRKLPKGYDVKTHFTPSYNPWDQRICLVPNGDLFKTISRGDASVVTDRIVTFTETGMQLESGAQLDADIIVTATGLNVVMMGGAELSMDGEKVDVGDRMTYRGMILDGIPNMAFAVGYSNASFTLKCDLTIQYVCRLINHMEATGTRSVVAPAPTNGMDRIPVLDLTSGYIQRSLDKFPKQGAEVPWRLYQNYPRDIRSLLKSDLEDGVLEFVS